jgi:hypothetical protein
MPKKACMGSKIEKSEDGVPLWTVPAFKMFANFRVGEHYSSKYYYNQIHYTWTSLREDLTSLQKVLGKPFSLATWCNTPKDRAGQHKACQSKIQTTIHEARLSQDKPMLYTCWLCKLFHQMILPNQRHFAVQLISQEVKIIWLCIILNRLHDLYFIFRQTESKVNNTHHYQAPSDDIGTYWWRQYWGQAEQEAKNDKTLIKCLQFVTSYSEHGQILATSLNTCSVRSQTRVTYDMNLLWILNSRTAAMVDLRIWNRALHLY